jgi:hypothetical protein
MSGTGTVKTVGIREKRYCDQKMRRAIAKEHPIFSEYIVISAGLKKIRGVYH